MAPTSTAKPRSFTFTLTDDELRMLHELAESEGRPASNWLRQVIRVTYEKRAKRKSKR